MSDPRLVPAHVDALLERLAVPVDERSFPLQRVLDTGHILEIRAERGRYFLCGLLNEFPVSPSDPLIETLLEAPFHKGACGYLAYEPMGENLLYWSEIIPATEPGGSPSPDLRDFLRDVTELSKKVSLSGGL